MTAYQIDLDPVHSVVRLTVTAEVMTLEMAQEIHTRLAYLSSLGKTYSAIFDLSAVKCTTIPVAVIRGYGRRSASVPMGHKHVIVGQHQRYSDWLACSRCVGRP
jgi:hypothetical protein